MALSPLLRTARLLHNGAAVPPLLRRPRWLAADNRPLVFVHERVDTYGRAYRKSESATVLFLARLARPVCPSETFAKLLDLSTPSDRDATPSPVSLLRAAFRTLTLSARRFPQNSPGSRVRRWTR